MSSNPKRRGIFRQPRKEYPADSTFSKKLNEGSSDTIGNSESVSSPNYLSKWLEKHQTSGDTKNVKQSKKESATPTAKQSSLQQCKVDVNSEFEGIQKFESTNAQKWKITFVQASEDQVNRSKPPTICADTMGQHINSKAKINVKQSKTPSKVKSDSKAKKSEFTKIDEKHDVAKEKSIEELYSSTKEIFSNARSPPSTTNKGKKEIKTQRSVGNNEICSSKYESTNLPLSIIDAIEESCHTLQSIISSKPNISNLIIGVDPNVHSNNNSIENITVLRPINCSFSNRSSSSPSESNSVKSDHIAKKRIERKSKLPTRIQCKQQNVTVDKIPEKKKNEMCTKEGLTSKLSNSAASVSNKSNPKEESSKLQLQIQARKVGNSSVGTTCKISPSSPSCAPKVFSNKVTNISEANPKIIGNKPTIKGVKKSIDLATKKSYEEENGFQTTISESIEDKCNDEENRKQFEEQGKRSNSNITVTSAKSSMLISFCDSNQGIHNDKEKHGHLEHQECKVGKDENGNRFQKKLQRSNPVLKEGTNLLISKVNNNENSGLNNQNKDYNDSGVTHSKENIKHKGDNIDNPNSRTFPYRNETTYGTMKIRNIQCIIDSTANKHSCVFLINKWKRFKKKLLKNRREKFVKSNNLAPLKNKNVPIRATNHILMRNKSKNRNYFSNKTSYYDLNEIYTRKDITVSTNSLIRENNSHQSILKKEKMTQKTPLTTEVSTNTQQNTHDSKRASVNTVRSNKSEAGINSYSESKVPSSKQVSKSISKKEGEEQDIKKVISESICSSSKLQNMEKISRKANVETLAKTTQIYQHITASQLYCRDWIKQNMFYIEDLNPFTTILDTRDPNSSTISCMTSSGSSDQLRSFENR